MKYKLFGKSGLRVSELGLGSMTIGNKWGWGSDKDEAQKIFNSFVNAGGNFIDTACNYQNERVGFKKHNEMINVQLMRDKLAEFLKK